VVEDLEDQGLEGETSSVSEIPKTNITRAVGSMATGTVLSRATGLLRILVLAYVLGISPLADSYNLANTVPNMLYDVVLGGVLAATFIPVFVERLTLKTEREAWRSISSVVTLAVVVLAAATLVTILAAPWIIDAFTFYHHVASTKDPTKLASQRQLATELLRWFAPQIFFYGLWSIATALLNVRRKFGAPMWVPIANNLVCIAVLLFFASIDPAPSLHSVTQSQSQVLLLGLGTTAGVVAQTLLLIPSLARSRLRLLRWRFDLRDEAVAAIVRLGSWTFGFVILNQIALYVILALAFGSGGVGPVSSYTYAYTFFQMPYAVVAVSVMSAVTPDLATHHTLGDLEAFARRFGSGLRAVLAVIIPSSIAIFVLARPAVALLLGHGNADAAQTRQTGTMLAELSLGLVGFVVFQFVIRALQAMQRARAAFWLYLVENGLTVLAALLLVKPLGLAGLGLAIALGYNVGALGGLALLHSWLGRLGAPGCYRPLGRVLVASLAMGITVLVISNLSTATSGPALFLRVAGSVILGGLVYLGTISWLARRRVRR
jgi:putative peptidoglycan lipid II flippase